MAEARQHVTITNKRGLHARASAKFVTLASSFAEEIEVHKDGHHVAGTSIMGLMMLAAGPGDSIEIIARGPAAETTLAALVQLVEEKFGEE